MQTSKQKSILAIATNLAVLGLSAAETHTLARKLYSGVEGKYLPLPTKTVGKEIVLYGKDATVCLDTVTCEIDTVIKKAA